MSDAFILGVLLADPSFWIGLVAVGMFGWTRFNDRQWDEEEIDPRIPTRSFTTRFRYHLAALTYTGAYGILYVALIVLGSFPFSQRLLVEFIGTIEGKDIGTPAWAAMAVTAVLPALPFFKRLDQGLRARFHNFASIPLKVRHLADEILAGLTRAPGAAAHGGRKVYASLEDCVKRLKTSPRLSAARDYGDFFARYRSVQEDLAEQVEGAASDDNGRAHAERVSSAQWQSVNKRLSRLIACAVLHVERDEFAARDVLSSELAIPRISPGRWRFTLNQIALGGFAVVLAVFAGFGGGGLVEVHSYQSFAGDATVPQIAVTLLASVFMIGVLAIPIFVLPVIFAAGVQMYLLDRKQFGLRLEWHDLLLARVVTFLGAYLAALLPALVMAAIHAHFRDDDAAPMAQAVPIAHWLPWALPPAAMATLFVIQSTFGLTASKSVNGAIDFAAHAAVAVAATMAAYWLSMLAGFQPETALGVPSQSFLRIAVMTAALTGGTLGAVECAVSRRCHFAERSPGGVLAPAHA